MCEEECRRTSAEDGKDPEIHVGYMLIGDEKEGSTLALLVARERTTKAVFKREAVKKSTGEWICVTLVAWHREIGLVLGDIFVKLNNELALKEFD